MYRVFLCPSGPLREEGRQRLPVMYMLTLVLFIRINQMPVETAFEIREAASNCKCC